MANKLQMSTKDIVEEQIDYIGARFPSVISETIEDGRLVKKIDFEMLQQELSSALIETGKERYQFVWPDKKKALLAANSPLRATLRPIPSKSVNFERTKNLYIEGDNLEALKLIRETYLGKVKMIYIDPPYNTGNDFIYNDKFAQGTDEFLLDSSQIDEQGNRMTANTNANGRFHTDWLNMMYPRLRIAKDLLTSDGVIFISIDDNELFNLKKICDEIFGEQNFVAQLAVQLNPRGRNLDVFVAKTFESVLVYAKDYGERSSINGIEKEGRMVEEYNLEDQHGKFRAIGLRNRNQAFNPQTRPNLYYPLYVDPNTGRVSTAKSDVFVDEVWPDAPDGTKTCWTWMKKKVDEENDLIIAFKTGEEWRVFRKDYLLKDGETATTLVKSLWTDNTINNDYGKKAIKELFGSNVMSFPKAPELIKKMIKIATNRDSIVLDFFSGSATTAEAVMQTNIEDGGNRQFIMVQLPEMCDEDSDAFKMGLRTICDIGEERIKRSAKKLMAENPLLADKFDGGVRVFKVDSSNMKDNFYSPAKVVQSLLTEGISNIKPDRNSLDLLFQIMLELGIDLSAHIETRSISSKDVLFVNGNFLVACFDADVDEKLIKEIAEHKPVYAVFRDASFASDSANINCEQLIKAISPSTELKVL